MSCIIRGCYSSRSCIAHSISTCLCVYWWPFHAYVCLCYKLLDKREASGAQCEGPARGETARQFGFDFDESKHLYICNGHTSKSLCIAWPSIDRFVSAMASKGTFLQARTPPASNGGHTELIAQFAEHFSCTHACAPAFMCIYFIKYKSLRYNNRALLRCSFFCPPFHFFLRTFYCDVLGTNEHQIWTYSFACLLCMKITLGSDMQTLISQASSMIQ